MSSLFGAAYKFRWNSEVAPPIMMVVQPFTNKGRGTRLMDHEGFDAGDRDCI